MAKMEYDDVLAHFGVLGMKWGVRKREESSGRSGSSSGKGPNREQRRTARRAQKSNALKSKAANEQRTLDSLNKQGYNSPYMLKKYGPAIAINTPAARMKIQLLNLGRPKEALLAAEKHNVQHSRDHFLDDAKLAAAGKWTSKSKMLLGAGIVLAILASAAGAIILGKKFNADKIARAAERAAQLKRNSDSLKKVHEDIAAKALAEKIRLNGIKAGESVTKDDWWQKMVNTELDRVSGVSKDAFEGMDETPVSVPPGRVFHRMSKDSEEILRDRLYASVEGDDSDRYKATMPMFWQKQREQLAGLGFDMSEYGDDADAFDEDGALKPPPGGGFQVAIKAVNEIRSPGAKTRVKEYIKLLDTPLSQKKELTDYLQQVNDMRQFTGKKPLDLAQATVRDLMDDGNSATLDNEAFALKTYRNFALGLAADSPINSAYFDGIKKLGFNALIDDNDAGKLSDAPFIIFDSDKDLKRIGATPITAEEVRKAQEKIKELLNRG